MTYTYRIEDPDDYDGPYSLQMWLNCKRSAYLIFKGSEAVGWTKSRKAARYWCRRNQEKAA